MVEVVLDMEEEVLVMEVESLMEDTVVVMIMEEDMEDTRLVVIFIIVIEELLNGGYTNLYKKMMTEI